MSEKYCKGFHYTNPHAYRSMETGRMYGHRALLPIRRFVSFGGGRDLPEEAYQGTVQCLLEPEPSSWIDNPEFPVTWEYFMNDVLLKDDQVMLLCFDISPSDTAYVVDRAYIERLLYQQEMDVDKEATHKATRKYWESRIPIFDYRDEHTLPQLIIWNPIEFSRLHVEWKKPSKSFWQNIS